MSERVAGVVVPPGVTAATVVAADRLSANDYNPNRMNEVVERAERESIEQFGFIDPITVRPDPDDPERFIIIDGEHRWRIGQELGLTEFPVVVLHVTEAQAKKLTIVLNETRGDADVVLLGQLLNDLKLAAPDDSEFLQALPYTAAELDHLLSIGAADWDQFAPGNGGTGSGSGGSADHQLVLDFDDAAMLERFQAWLGVLRKEYDLEQDDPTGVVVEAVRRAAESA